MSREQERGDAEDALSTCTITDANGNVIYTGKNVQDGFVTVGVATGSPQDETDRSAEEAR